MPVPVFSVGETLTSAAMNAVGIWRITTCTASFAGGTAGTASNGVITIGTNNTSVTISNAFSSSFNNYLIIWQGGTMSGDTALKCQLGSTTTGYYGSYVYSLYTGTTTTAAGDNNASSFTYVGGGNASAAMASFNLYGPNTATRTYCDASDIGYGTQFGRYSGIEISSTQHTGFSLIPFSGTMSSGTIRVYGYNK